MLDGVAARLETVQREGEDDDLSAGERAGRAWWRAHVETANLKWRAKEATKVIVEALKAQREAKRRKEEEKQRQLLTAQRPLLQEMYRRRAILPLLVRYSGRMAVLYRNCSWLTLKLS